MQPIFRFDGRYFGFLREGQYLYRHDGQYVGWLARSGEVYLSDGAYLGRFDGTSFVVREEGRLTPPRAVVKAVAPSGKIAPVRWPDRVKTVPAAGVRDALVAL